MHDLSAETRVLLGTVGWQRDDWLRNYYPEDLPSEWRLAYYANDCACVMLSADNWCTVDRGLLEESLDEAGGRLWFFLEQPTAQWRDVRDNLALFAASPAVLLVDGCGPVVSGLPQWVAQGKGVWVDTESGASLLRWSLDVMDLRLLRRRAQALPSTLRALVLGGPAATPGRIPELRTLLELMGKA